MRSTYPDRGRNVVLTEHPTGAQAAAAAAVIRRRAAAEQWPEGPEQVLDMLGLDTVGEDT